MKLYFLAFARDFTSKSMAVLTTDSISSSVNWKLILGSRSDSFPTNLIPYPFELVDILDTSDRRLRFPRLDEVFGAFGEEAGRDGYCFRVISWKGLVIRESDQLDSFRADDKLSIDMVTCPYW